MKTWLAAVLSILLPCAADAATRYGAPSGEVPAGLDRLVRSYPDVLSGHDDRWLVFKDGRRMAISDGRQDKTFDELLEHPDIDDMFYAPYPAGADATAPAADPGRVRYAPLFDAMYGDCRKGPLALRPVAWMPRHHGGTLDFATANGADKALEAAVGELDALPDRFMPYLVPSDGTFNCRTIAGSAARSAHGWGIAIDINAKASEYWRWSGGHWHNRIPMEIVRIFERHGFIWGGRWAHYDTMHFEYRPELFP